MRLRLRDDADLHARQFFFSYVFPQSVDLAQQRIRLAKPGEIKTNKRRPIVPIAPELLPVIQRLMKGPDAVLLDLGDVNYAFGRACQAAGIEGATPPARIWPWLVQMGGGRAGWAHAEDTGRRLRAPLPGLPGRGAER